MTVRVALTADASEVGRIFGAGFEDDPVLSWVFAAPGTRQKLEVMFTCLATELFVPANTSFLVDGGAAAWMPPDAPAPPDGFGERFGAALTEVATGDDLDRLRRMGEATQAAHPDEAHWYLRVLATWPDRRAQGVGTTLLEHTLALVDAAGMPAYLESTNPRNQTLYQRHGFEPTGVIDIPDGPSMTPMWRPAR